MPAGLTPDLMNDFSIQHQDWVTTDESISRTCVFTDFNATMRFLTRIALASEVADHHPDIDICWNKVTIVLSTHSEKALTSKDLNLATTLDSFVR